MTAFQARLTVNLDALAANYRQLQAIAGSAEIAPVVKANAYGLGMGPIAGRLRAEGAQSFFVARVGEGLALRRRLGPDPAIYVFDGCPPGAAAALLAAGLRPILNDVSQCDAWLNAGGGEAALHVDTGMNRLGLSLEDSERIAKRGGRLAIGLVLSHLSCGSSEGHPMNWAQAERFQAVRSWFPNARASLANSGGLFQDPAFALDMARPGIALYGGGPFDRPDRRLSTVATLEAPILQLRQVEAGASIGYGATFVAEGPLTVAVIAAGYADGVLRAQSAVGYGWLHGARRRYLGLISMDLIAIDVTDAPQARVGDWVQLLGPERPLDEVAESANTKSYEILTRLGARARRRYQGARA